MGLIDLNYNNLIKTWDWFALIFDYLQVIDSSLKFGRQLDSDHIPLQHFFIVLEHVLRHGLKPKKVRYLSPPRATRS